MHVDLNSDLGEGFGPWRMGDDEGLLGVVTSANIACGFHAGDPGVMARAMRLAGARGVGIGAHPGFADLQGFGRRRLRLSADELAQMTAYQLGAAQGMARLLGHEVRHLKLHGALSNMATEDPAIARACFQAALQIDPHITLVVLAATPMEAVARDLGARCAAEVYADRGYDEAGLLLDRSLPGAVLHDPAEIAARMVGMLRGGAIFTANGARIPCAIDTICVHGDDPGALATAQSLRAALSEAGIDIRRF